MAISFLHKGDPLKVPVFLDEKTLLTTKHVFQSVPELELIEFHEIDEFEKFLIDNNCIIAMISCLECTKNKEKYADICRIIEANKWPFYIAFTSGKTISSTVNYYQIGVGALLYDGFKTKELRDAISVAHERAKFWVKTMDDVLANKAAEKEFSDLLK